ncbi:hypothetical protein E2C01_098161 [Portunus trituberculatus]|uniref:Uncharacterized protein n=1 Tax=Portunus trituberculatus TaxID=210409 RepID=A0A5B7K6D8_PORTR|nr:hypothetical protein [Portunus trituberculatus]
MLCARKARTELLWRDGVISFWVTPMLHSRFPSHYLDRTGGQRDRGGPRRLLLLFFIYTTCYNVYEAIKVLATPRQPPVGRPVQRSAVPRVWKVLPKGRCFCASKVNHCSLPGPEQHTGQPPHASFNHLPASDSWWPCGCPCPGRPSPSAARHHARTERIKFNSSTCVPTTRLRLTDQPQGQSHPMYGLRYVHAHTLFSKQ